MDATYKYRVEVIKNVLGPAGAGTLVSELDDMSECGLEIAHLDYVHTEHGVVSAILVGRYDSRDWEVAETVAASDKETTETTSTAASTATKTKGKRVSKRSKRSKRASSGSVQM